MVKHPVWTFSSEDNGFINFCSDYNLSQLGTQPTRAKSSSGNILDLILTCPHLLSPILHLPGLSDHGVLHFELNIRTSATSYFSKCIRDYGKAHFYVVNKKLSIARPLRAFCIVSWDLIFLFKIRRAFDMYVPIRSVYLSSGSLWYTRALGRLGNNNKKKKNVSFVLQKVILWANGEPLIVLYCRRFL